MVTRISGPALSGGAGPEIMDPSTPRPSAASLRMTLRGEVAGRDRGFGNTPIF